MSWRGYVGDNRNQQTCPFLIEVLREFRNKRGRILDVAPGLGDEIICLDDNDYDVEANEADPTFYNLLKMELEQRRKNIPVYNYDWREFNKLKDFFGKYAAIILIGNDLSMIRNEDEQLLCLRNFYNMLKKGGILIIDTRNYERISECITKGNGICDYDNQIGRKIMYTGKGVSLKLKRRLGKDELVVFEFYDARSKRKLGEIETVPLTREKLKELLEKVGFIIEEEYSDLQKGYRKDAEFYTFIARKPDKK